MFIRHKSVFDIIKEAEDDNKPEKGAEDTAPADDDNVTGDDDSGDDFDVPNDPGDDFDDSGDVDDAGGDDTGSTDTGSDNSGDEEGAEQSAEAKSTDDTIFDSLSDAEKTVKTNELKKMFLELYNSSSDIVEKINSVKITDDNKKYIVKLVNMIETAKEYLVAYIQNSFKEKSYIENDISFNNFLHIFNCIRKNIDKFVDLSIEK